MNRAAINFCFDLTVPLRRDGNGVWQFSLRIEPFFHWCVTDYAARPDLKIEARREWQWRWRS